MEEELLQKIVNNTNSKFSSQIVLSSEETKFNTRFSPPISLDSNKKYEIALVNLETYYSFPNVDSTNNRLSLKHKDENPFYINIPEGSYEIESLNRELQTILEEKGYSGAVTFQPNRNTLKSIMAIQPGYRVSFKGDRSLRQLLGFNDKWYKEGVHESENIVNILSINSILVNIDIITGSFINGVSKPVIYSFFPNVSPGFKIVETPYNLVYLPIATETIDHITTTITDQNHKPLNLRGETITIRFHLREC